MGGIQSNSPTLKPTHLEGVAAVMNFSMWLLVSLLADVWSSSHLGDNRMKTTNAPVRNRAEKDATRR
jgi:hypothetical protein